MTRAVKPPRPGKPPADYGPIQFRTFLKEGCPELTSWKFDELFRHGLIPVADVGARWSGTVVEDVKARLPELLAHICQRHPVGAKKAAEWIRENYELDVDAADVDELVSQGLLQEAKDYRGKALEHEDRYLYDFAELDRVAFEYQELIAELAAERKAWLADSEPRRDVYERLGWSERELLDTMKAKGIRTGRFNRLSKADVAALENDEELDEEVTEARLLLASQAVQLLEIRQVDWKYITAAGWITPVKTERQRASWTRRRVLLDVPYYRQADVVALREHPEINLEALRCAGHGQPSPLAQKVNLPVSRGTWVKAFAADLSAEFEVDVDAAYERRGEVWTLSWTLNGEQRPTEAEVREAINADRTLAQHSERIELKTLEPA